MEDVKEIKEERNDHSEFLESLYTEDKVNNDIDRCLFGMSILMRKAKDMGKVSSNTLAWDVGHVIEYHMKKLQDDLRNKFMFHNHYNLVKKLDR